MAHEPVIELLRAIKANLIRDLLNIDLALARLGGGDLVVWAGPSQFEQRCSRCTFWIFQNDPICAVATEPGASLYVHRKCVVRSSNTEEGRPHEQRSTS